MDDALGVWRLRVWTKPYGGSLNVPYAGICEWSGESGSPQLAVLLDVQ